VSKRRPDKQKFRFSQSISRRCHLGRIGSISCKAGISNGKPNITTLLYSLCWTQ
jgi:hypothetical protein